MSHTLNKWDDIKSTFQDSTLLLGNGASMAVWKKFGYQSLYDYAVKNGMLTKQDEAFFKLAETTNFEQILSNLKISEETCRILGLSTADIKKRHDSIRNSLANAVNDIHVDWAKLSATATLDKICVALRAHKYVFSTNYDLLVYWSRMSASAGKGFTDYFFNANGEFDITNVTIRSAAVTRVLYLHGALHLYVDPMTGITRKHINAGTGNNIQSLFSANSGVPLFISEGDSKNKLMSIYRSDYLSFVYQTFVNNKLPTVIFGQGLVKKFDQHIISAINSWKPNAIPVAVSIYPSGDGLVDQKRMTELALELRDVSPIFFDSRTHPLGAADLEVK